MPGTQADRFRILFVEDDERLAALTTRYLEGHGHTVTWLGDGQQGLAEGLKGQHDVVILDLLLPRKSGLEVCRELRARLAVPIIMLTALGEEADRVLGLEMGADDYLTKPFSSRELLARLRALVRRGRGALGPPRDRIQVGALELSPRDYGATLAGVPLNLTTSEFLLLRVLAERAGRVLSREQLLDLTKGSADEAFDRSIDAHVSRLRHKLGDDPRQPRLLKTIRGAGYMLAIGPEDE
ncbi:response regulator transcription factor [Anaeromyxobacter oryzae]|uniref:response regulator transcription factor n=1 Tax=Anaeromyxobacter oryzae TaxID=2918170 RepID=UPI0020BDD66E|nr:response regulator transcription factor [Anaeromyxobacter oryzae]